MPLENISLEELQNRLGQELDVSDWFTVHQGLIDGFAAASSTTSGSMSPWNALSAKAL
jgi:hypothetical protein